MPAKGKRTPESIAKSKTALELRHSGATYPQIAQAMQCAQSTAHEYVQAALRETIQEPADAVRELELARLDVMLKALWQTVLNGSPSEKRNAVDRCLAIQDRRARYLGLDAPQRRIVEIVTEDEFARTVKALEDEIGELESDGQVEGEPVA